jgi:hypothetical protein
MTDRKEEVRSLLEALHDFLMRQGEHNWIRGVRVALDEIDAPDGLERVRSVYATMNKGNGSFFDYNVWEEDDKTRAKVNKELYDLRSRLWTLLEL